MHRECQLDSHEVIDSITVSFYFGKVNLQDLNPPPHFYPSLPLTYIFPNIKTAIASLLQAFTGSYGMHSFLAHLITIAK